MKRITSIIAVVGLISLSGAVFAAELQSPSQIAAALTGKTVTELAAERAEGKTYGTIADEAGKLEEFQKLMLEQKKAILEQRVKDGIMTQAEADALIQAIEENQADCDGTGSKQLGRGAGAGFGMGMGNGNGMRGGQGNGQGLRGMGAGCLIDGQ